MPNDVSAPLPDVDVVPQAVVTVTTGVAGAVITSLVAHGYQDDSATSTPFNLELSPAFLPGGE